MKKDKGRKPEVVEVVELNEEQIPEVVEEVTKVAKPKWSLKKKLMIGGGVLAGLAIGAIALINKQGGANIDQVEAEDDYADSADVVETTTEEVQEEEVKKEQGQL